MNVKCSLILTSCFAALFLSGCFNREEEIINEHTLRTKTPRSL